jgi:hypothetical protein
MAGVRRLLRGHCTQQWLHKGARNGFEHVSLILHERRYRKDCVGATPCDYVYHVRGIEAGKD